VKEKEVASEQTACERIEKAFFAWFVWGGKGNRKKWLSNHWALAD